MNNRSLLIAAIAVCSAIAAPSRAADTPPFECSSQAYHGRHEACAVNWAAQLTSEVRAKNPGLVEKLRRAGAHMDDVERVSDHPPADGADCVSEAYRGHHEACAISSEARYSSEFRASHRYLFDEARRNAAHLDELNRIRDHMETHTSAPAIGMTPDEVRDTYWGEPGHINRTVTASASREQWVYQYPKGSFLYFENGRLVAIQTQ